MPKLQGILDETRDFLDQINIRNPESREARELSALIHVNDHMQRLLERCDEDLERAVVASQRSELTEVEIVMDSQIDGIIVAVGNENFELAEELSASSYQHTSEMEDPQREKIYNSVARGEIDIRYATECAEALRWLTRASRHISRICFYLNKSRQT
jgi:phosphate:Na+ symporter